MVFGELADAIQRIDAGLRRAQGVRIDVRGVEHRPVEQTFLTEKDGQRIDLFAGAASRDPHLQGGIGPQVRQHLFAQGPEIGRVPEHLADLDRQETQQTRQHLRIMQNPLLKGRQAGQTEMAARLEQAALDRGPRIVTEVVVVALEQGLQQQLDLYILHRMGRDGVQRGIQTRTSESSLSTSKGLAM
ncbi:hypothetical protein D3C86_1615010 [compost metagenome]